MIDTLPITHNTIKTTMLTLGRMEGIEAAKAKTVVIEALIKKIHMLITGVRAVSPRKLS